MAKVSYELSILHACFELSGRVCLLLSRSLKGGPWRTGQDKFRQKSGGVQATQYDPRGSTAIVYFNTVQCSPKFMAIIVASTNIAVPYRYLDTAVASHAHGHA